MAHPLERGWTRDYEVGKFDPDAERVRNPEPYTLPEAKRAHARASRDQAEAAVFKAKAWREYAKAEKAYRMAVAAEMVRLHSQEGVAWTVTGDLARGDEKIAELRAKRDAALGVAKASDDVSFQRAADRRTVDQLAAWSMRFAPDGEVPFDPSTGELRG